ncbi:GHMP kinase [Methanoplanus sp. FWC-SCC4]|uniref:Pantoate kinase n=1 Tax=Methanochimaera problematica TaxID=2609417 RepID=A0AA97FD34_9EURY|nr:pantoate kinase [Methanoplanus sp. FWC-SCC4]WOF16322.1 GHMP kinase [Methanoplanus sp. FWC-SCC4]
MGRTAVAFCPGHISGWFKRADPKNGVKGSVGGGIVVNKGVTSEVRESDAMSVQALKKEADGSISSLFSGSPPIEYAFEKLGILAEVITTTRLPAGSGFGLSAASLLSSLSAANSLFDLGLDNAGIAKIAHESEIKFNSGLGDVAALTGGGYICRQKPGIMGDIIRNYDMNDSISVISFGPLPTESILGNPKAMEKISSAFREVCPKTPAEFFEISREFAENSGLISERIRSVLLKCDQNNIPASMTMLGEGVFAYGKNAERILAGFGEVYNLNMSKYGFETRRND